MSSNRLWWACRLYRRTHRQWAASCISHCKPEILLPQQKLLTASKIRCIAFLSEMPSNFSRTGFPLSAVCPPFWIFSGAFQYRQTEIPYFETDKIPLTVSSPRVISFAMQPPNNSQPNRRNRSHVGRFPLSAPSVLHSDILLIRPPSSPLFVAKGHPQPWKLKIPIFWHPCLNSLIILSWLHPGINTISYKISPSISESVCRNQTIFLL